MLHNNGCQVTMQQREIYIVSFHSDDSCVANCFFFKKRENEKKGRKNSGRGLPLNELPCYTFSYNS